MRIKRADRDRDGIVGMIVRLVMVIEIVPGDRPQVVLPPNDRDPVRMHLVRRGIDLFPQQIGRIVLAPLSLRDDDGALAFHLGRLHHRVGHPIGLQGDGDAQVVGREHFMIRGIVLPRERVPAAAQPVDVPGEHALGVGGGALEQHMLHPV